MDLSSQPWSEVGGRGGDEWYSSPPSEDGKEELRTSVDEDTMITWLVFFVRGTEVVLQEYKQKLFFFRRRGGVALVTC